MPTPALNGAEAFTSLRICRTSSPSFLSPQQDHMPTRTVASTPVMVIALEARAWLGRRICC